MKNIPILILLLLFGACSSKPAGSLSNAEKDKIKTEVGPLLEQNVENVKEGNLDATMNFYQKSPDFLAVSFGRVFNYDEYENDTKKYFDAKTSQTVDESNVYYTFINRDYVIVTWLGSTTVTDTSGMPQSIDPLAISMVLRRVGNTWKVFYTNESGTSSSEAIDTMVVE